MNQWEKSGFHLCINVDLTGVKCQETQSLEMVNRPKSLLKRWKLTHFYKIKFRLTMHSHGVRHLYTMGLMLWLNILSIKMMMNWLRKNGLKKSNGMNFIVADCWLSAYVMYWKYFTGINWIHQCIQMRYLYLLTIFQTTF